MSNDIYSYIKENFGIEITDYQFKRDYIKEPLKRGEKPFKEDLEYLYNSIGLRRENLFQLFKVTKDKFVTWISFYKIRRNEEIRKKLIEETNLEKYGCKNSFLNEEIRNKIKQTNLEKYGVDYPFQSKIIQDKIIEDNLKKYGYKTYAGTDECKEKIKQTNIERYGVDYPLQSKEIREKCKETNLKKYGYKSVLSDKNIKEKAYQTKLEKYGNKNYNNFKKYFQTMNERYGVDYPLQSKEIYNKMIETNKEKYGINYYVQTDECKEKIKQTNIEKYGSEHPLQSLNYRNNVTKKKYGTEYYFQSDEFKEKSFKTKIKNHSFGKSKQEDEIYNLLIQKYPNVIRQYKSNVYPYKCDFYIPELDLYIEYQGYWMHGKEPYIGSDEQKEIIKLWESKNTEQNLRAIKIWSFDDVLKRETAKENKLNFLEFFDINDFIKWFNDK